MASERELLERIRQLEELNSALQDKLDAIYAIVVADEDDHHDEDDDGEVDNLVQIDRK